MFKNEGRFSKGIFIKGTLWDLFGAVTIHALRMCRFLRGASLLTRMAGYGIINAGGNLWRTQRRAGLSFINNSNLRVLTDVALPRYLSESIAFLKDRADGTVVDLQTVFLEITSQLMGKMAYNARHPRHTWSQRRPY